MKENEKREFAKRLEQIAQELKENVDAGKGRAYILKNRAAFGECFEVGRIEESSRSY